VVRKCKLILNKSYHFYLRILPTNIGNSFVSWLKIIGEQYLLICSEDQIVPLNIDYHYLKTKLVSQVDIGFQRDNAVIDELNDRNFILYYKTSFITGSVIDDKIVLSPRKNYDFNNFQWAKLVGNKLIGFRRSNENNIRFWKFCSIDLEELTEKTVKMSPRRNKGCDLSDMPVRLSILFLIMNNFSIINITGLEMCCMLILDTSINPILVYV
jgi:hypothetical protein